MASEKKISYSKEAAQQKREQLLRQLEANRLQTALNNSKPVVSETQSTQTAAAQPAKQNTSSIAQDAMNRYRSSGVTIAMDGTVTDVKGNSWRLSDETLNSLYSDSADNFRVMSDEEKQTAAYLYETEGRAAGEQYIDSIFSELNARRQQADEQARGDRTRQSGWSQVANSLLSVPMQVYGGTADALNLLGQNLDGNPGEVDYNSIWGDWAQGADTIRQTVRDENNVPLRDALNSVGFNIADDAQLNLLGRNLYDEDVFDFLYDTGMSTLDSLFASLHSLAGPVMLGLSAGSDAARDAKERGATDAQAAVAGVFSGAFEGLFEKFSLGELDRLKEVAPTSVKNVLTNFVRSTAVNASEEAVTETANIIYDTIALGDISNAKLTYDSYVEAGCSPKEARRMTARDMAYQILSATASGALQGGAMSGVGSAAGYINNRTTAPTSESASGSRVQMETDHYNSLSDVQKTMYDLRQSIEDGTATTAQRAIYKVLMGEKPTDAELLAIRSDPSAQAQIDRVLGTHTLSEDYTGMAVELNTAAGRNAQQGEEFRRLEAQHQQEIERQSMMEQAQRSLNNEAAVGQYFDQHTQPSSRAGLEAELEYASQMVKKYGNMPYGGTKQTRQRFDEWSAEVRRLQQELAKYPAPAEKPMLDDDAAAIMAPAETSSPDLAESFRESQTAKNAANTVTIGNGADFSSLDISNVRKNQLNAAQKVLGRLGVTADIDVKGDILTQAGKAVWGQIKNDPAVNKAMADYFGRQWSDFTDIQKTNHAAKLIGDAIRKDAAGQKLNSAERAVLRAAERGASDVRFARRKRHYESSRSIDDYSRIEYNKNGWAYVNDVLSVAESAAFNAKVAEMRGGGRDFHRSADGLYILEIGTYSNGRNVLVYTDGKWDSPSIEKVVKFKFDSEKLIEEEREYLYDLERQGVSEATEYATFVFGEEFCKVYNPDNYPSFQELTRERKGSSGAEDNRNSRTVPDGRRGGTEDSGSLSGNDGAIDGPTAHADDGVRFSLRKNDTAQIIERAKKDYSKALTSQEWSRFYSALSGSQNVGLRVGSNAILLYNGDNINDSKLICYNRTKDGVQVVDAFLLESFDETIHDEVRGVAKVIAEVVKNGYNSRIIENVLSDYDEAYGTVFRRYDPESADYVEITSQGSDRTVLEQSEGSSVRSGDSGSNRADGEGTGSVNFSRSAPVRTTQVSSEKVITGLMHGKYTVAQMRSFAQQIGVPLFNKKAADMRSELAAAIASEAKKAKGGSLTLELQETAQQIAKEWDSHIKEHSRQSEQKKKAEQAAQRKAEAERKQAEREAAKAEKQSAADNDRFNAEVHAAAKKSVAKTERFKGRPGEESIKVEHIDTQRFIKALPENRRVEMQRLIEDTRNFAKAFGHKVTFITDATKSGKYGVDGFYHGSSIYVNVESIRKMKIKTVAHEITHDMAAEDTSLITGFYNLYREYCEKHGRMDEFNERLNDVYNRYDDGVYDYRQLALVEEMLCDVFADLADGDSRFFDYCVNRKPTLVQRLVEFFNRIINKLTRRNEPEAAIYAAELRGYLLDAAAKYKAGKGIDNRLSGAVRSDARAAQRTIAKTDGKYQLRADVRAQPQEWSGDISGNAAMQNLRDTAPRELTDFGFRDIIVGGKKQTVLVVDPQNYLKAGSEHMETVEAARRLAANFGIPIGFTVGQSAAMTKTDGRQREVLSNYDSLRTDTGTLLINLDSNVPYTHILTAAWCSWLRRADAVTAAEIDRLARRIASLTGRNITAEKAAQQTISGRKAERTADAIRMRPDEVLAWMMEHPETARAFAHENPNVIRRLSEKMGDVILKVFGKGNDRAAALTAQLQARLLHTFSRTADAAETMMLTEPSSQIEKRRGKKKKPLPDDMRLMAASERFKGSLLGYSNDLERTLRSNPNNVIIGSREQLDYYVREAFENVNSKKSLYLGRVPLAVMESIKEDIENISDENRSMIFKANSEYSVEIGQEDIRHIKKTGMSVEDVLDYVACLPAIITEYDSVHFTEYVQGRNKLKALRFKKALSDGTYVAVEVASRKRNSLETHNIFIESEDYKKRKSAPTAYAADATQAQTSMTWRSSTSDTSVPHPDGSVKFSRSLRSPTRQETRTWLDEYSEQYGAIPEGENVNSRGDQNIPRQTADDTRTRQTVRTYLEALSTPDDVAGELERDIINGTFAYTPVSNKKANNYADTVLARGLDEAMAEWHGITRGGKPATKEAIALGERLIIEAASDGNTKLATKMIAEVAAEATRAGQIVQAISMVKRLSPTGQLLSIQRQVDKLNDERQGRGKEISISEDKLKEFTDIAKQLEDAQRRISELEEMLENGQEHTDTGYTEDELNDAREQEQQLKDKLGKAKNGIITDVAEQVQPTWKDKMNAWRYLAMLGNPRTHIRNLVGNMVFIPAVKLKQAMASGMEKAFIKKGERSQQLTASRSLREFAAHDAAEQLSWLKSGGKYNATDEITEQTKAFSEKNAVGRTLNKLADFNSWAMDAEDGIFLRYHYQTALAGWAAANGVSAHQLRTDEALLQKARAFAAREAQRATYRDMNAFSDFMSQASRKLRAKQGIGGAVAYAAFEGVVPFKKTPCNIVKRSMEYSPIGVMTALSKGGRKLWDAKRGVDNDYTASEFINDLSAGMTGTMIVGLGALLASLGVLRGRDKDKEDEFEKLQGAQEYSLVIGDASYTIDWMSPVALPLFVGAELYNQTTNTNEDFSLKTLLDSLTMIAEPIFNLSMLDGVQSTLQSYSSEGVIMDVFTGAVESYAGQFFPTIGGQIARTIDPLTRNAYFNDRNSSLPDWFSQIGRSAMAKTPGVYSQLPERIDAWGRNVGEGQTTFERFAENFISPGYYSQSKTTEVDRVIQQIYEATGDSSILPATASKYFSYNGQNYYMSADEYVTYAKTRGQTAYNIIDELRQSSAFMKLSPGDQAACVSDAYKLATVIAKCGTNSGYTIADAYIWQREAYESGDYAEAILNRR